MVITAKFSSVCPHCNGRIEVGSKVEWSRGSKARHVACGSAVAASVVSAAPARHGATGYRRRGTWTGCSCGSVQEYSRPSDCWTCRHDAE